MVLGLFVPGVEGHRPAAAAILEMERWFGTKANSSGGFCAVEHRGVSAWLVPAG
jgi:hypothetical protein